MKIPKGCIMKICRECMLWRLATSIGFWNFIVGEKLEVVEPLDCIQTCHSVKVYKSGG